MKGNDGTGNIPERDLWETKQELFNKLNKQYDFTFDCCALAHNTKCENFSSDFLNSEVIIGTAWMNPPFTKAKEMFEQYFKIVSKGVSIFRCDNMETKVWQDIILKNASWILIPKGRISYTPFETGDMRKGMGSRFPSALIGINVEPPTDIEGATLFLNNTKVGEESKKFRKGCTLLDQVYKEGEST